MKQIYIGFSKARSKYAFLSKIICWAQGTSFSHVYVKLKSESLAGRELIYQASGSQVNFENAEHFDHHAKTVQEYALDVDDSTFESVVGFCVDNLNKPYSRRQLISIAFVMLMEKLGRKVKNPYRNRLDGQICAEIAARIMRLMGMEVGVDDDSVTPKDLCAFLEKYKTNNRTI